MSTNRTAADQLAALQQRMARREAQRDEKREARMVSLRREVREREADEVERRRKKLMPSPSAFSLSAHHHFPLFIPTIRCAHTTTTRFFLNRAPDRTTRTRRGQAEREATANRRRRQTNRSPGGQRLPPPRP